MAGARKANATIFDVAARAGVSASTVSRHLRGESVRAADEIDRAIGDLAFRPSPLAQSLKSGRTASIALVVPDVSNPFFAAVARGAEGACAREGFTVILSNTDESAEREARVLEGLVGRVDGVIMAPASEDDENPRLLAAAGVPLVFLDREVRSDAGPGPGAFDTVLVDNRGGARSAVRHLVALGHTEIAIISGPETSTPGRERLEGFREAIDHAGLELRPEHVESGAFRTREGYQAMLRLMGCPRPPTAVFVANNLMTLGALQALRDLSVSVPEEISIVGFDDHVFADLLAAPLTVVQRPMEEQGALATRLLLSRIQGRAGDTARRIVLDTSLVVRASSAAPATRRLARIARVADG